MRFGPAKIGQRVHMEDLLKNGTLYMNPLSEHSTFEENKVRGDEHEALFRLVQAKQCRIFAQIDGEPASERMEINSTTGLIGQVKFGFPDMLTIPTYSMFFPEFDKKGRVYFDQRLWEFGDTIVVVEDEEEFFKRLLKARDDQGIKLEATHISYVDKESYSGEMGFFRKLKEYEYQAEWRCMAHCSKAPLPFKLGSIEDIAKIYSKEEFELFLESDPE